MNTEYFKDSAKSAILCKFVTYLHEAASKFNPDNAVQFDSMLAEKLKDFIAANSVGDPESFRKTAYDITDAMNYGVNLLPSVYRLSSDYDKEFLPEDKAVVSGILYGAAILADVQGEFRDKADFLAAAGFMYDMVAVARRAQQYVGSTSKALH